jgi:hypothetical protein
MFDTATKALNFAWLLERDDLAWADESTKDQFITSLKVSTSMCA